MVQKLENGEYSANEKRRYFTTVDLATIGLLAGLGNLVSSGLDLFKPFFKGLPVPVFQLLGGYHLIWLILAFGFTKKRGSPTMTALIKGILEFMLWDPFFGPWVIPLCIVEGIMIDFGLWAFQRLENERTIWILSGIVGNAIQPVVSYSIIFYYLGKSFPDPYILFFAMLFAIISGALIAGLLGHELNQLFHRKDVRAYITST
ncbi:MAG: ECF transporter S component [Candidatus Hodarchaeota archaeon]